MIDEDFLMFCRKCTDQQPENVLLKEYSRHKHGDYDTAMIAAAERDWVVKSGERIA
jgi:hypothetical protein